MKCTLVVSVYNEEQVLEQFYGEVTRVAAGLDCEVELLMVDDGSSDGSAAIMERLAAADSRVRTLHFSRNFGHEAAMLAGIDHATGDAVVCMDADLQHPPALLPDMLRAYGEGADVVTMVRRERADGGWLRRVTSKAFYRIINRMADCSLEPNASDFFLVSGRVAQVLRTQYRERTRFLRGFIQTVGFERRSLAFDAPERAAGQSKYSLHRLVRLSLGAIASFSKAPLRLGLYGGLAFGLLSVALIVYSIVMWIVQRPVGGYTTLIIFLSAFACILLLVMGLIGYYIGLIFDEVKGRPIYILKDDNDRC